ncbi:hypothetical protein BGW80DRAFT_24303 [Lactifluus volemus]|nr:hypothetical protein BGW80DRAFT_24303 [Lactifluus volemus]
MHPLPPPQINLDKSHSVQSRQTNTSSKHKVVTRPPWAKNEPPSPADSDRDPRSSPSSSGSSEARRPDIDNYTSRGGPPGGEHRWFPFTRHLPVLPPSELFSGATGESSPIRLEKRPAIFRTPSSLRDAYTAALGEKNAEAGPSRKPVLRIAMPTPPSTPYTLPAIGLRGGTHLGPRNQSNPYFLGAFRSSCRTDDPRKNRTILSSSRGGGPGLENELELIY